MKYPIWLLCEIAEIRRTTYYKYKDKPLKKDSGIEKLTLDIYHKTKKRAGYRPIKYILKDKYGLIVNHKKILRIMSEHGIQSIVRKKKYKKPEKTTIKENILNRDFKASKPYQKFVTDITYIPTHYKMIYLCTIIDLFNNEPLVYNISDCQDQNLCIEAVKELSTKCNLQNSLIHSDQGAQYTSHDYVDLLKDLEVKQSMSRKGNCWDNAKAECFFSHYKCEGIYILDRKIKDMNDVVQITEEYMDYYINYRPQKALGRLSPSAYKESYFKY